MIAEDIGAQSVGSIRWPKMSSAIFPILRISLPNVYENSARFASPRQLSYDSHDALKEVDLDIYPDDFLGIIGLTAEAKLRLSRPSWERSPIVVRSLFTAVVSGKGRLIGSCPAIDLRPEFSISVLEVVMSGLQGQGVSMPASRPGIERRHRSCCGRPGIDRIARKPIGEISGGQMQQALLCRAVISDPKLLILDGAGQFCGQSFRKRALSDARRAARTNGDRNDFSI